MALSRTTGILIGAGGIGSCIGLGLSRKGIGHLMIFDDDYVEPANLNRQFFFKRDLGKSKGERLAVNLTKHAFCETEFLGYGLSFQDALALKINLSADFAVIGVDNGRTRVEAARYFRPIGVPTVFVAVSLNAEAGYVFVQESKPNKPCFGCKFPKTLYGRKAPCKTPAVIDILQVVSGVALYAIDSLLMDRNRNWNYREIHLAGFAPDIQLSIGKREDCPLCG